MPPELPRESIALEHTPSRPHHYALLGVGVLVILVAFVAWMLVARPAAQPPFELVGSATSTWYALSGTALTRAPAPRMAGRIDGPSGRALMMRLQPPSSPARADAATPVGAGGEPHWVFDLASGSGTKPLGVGRPLGFLPNGNVLALTPLGLSEVSAADASSYQVLSTGGSSAALGAASSDLSLLAIEDDMTDTVTAYRFDSATLEAHPLGTLPAPDAPPIDGVATSSPLSNAPYLPVAVGMRGTTIIVGFARPLSPTRYVSYSVAGGVISAPVSLTLTNP